MAEIDQLKCRQEILRVKLRFIFLLFTYNHYVFLYSFCLNSYSSCNELRLTRILKNEICRRSMSASVTPFIPFNYFFVFEICLARILKNEIRRRPMSVSVSFFVIILTLSTFEVGELRLT